MIWRGFMNLSRSAILLLTVLCLCSQVRATVLILRALAYCLASERHCLSGSFPFQSSSKSTGWRGRRNM